MGRLVKGIWRQEDVNPSTPSGEFIRQEQTFRNWISSDGPHPPEKDRYHLYVSYACPWAHRTLILRELKELQEYISFSVVSPNMMEDGWSFVRDFPGATSDPVLHKSFLREIYTTADPQFTGKVTVPVLFDKSTQQIVNNESSEIVRILNSAFDELHNNDKDFYPADLRSEIDEINEYVYEHINNGVYKAGFARKQEVYDREVSRLFEALENIEERLSGGRNYLVGDRLTEADVRLYTTLVRFDVVYYFHFKCNMKRIRDFKHLSHYLLHLYEIKAFQSTTHFDHIRQHYYYSHPTINPFRIVPAGPEEPQPFGIGR